MSEASHLGLGLEQQRSLKADLLLVGDSALQEVCQVVQLQPADSPRTLILTIRILYYPMPLDLWRALLVCNRRRRSRIVYRIEVSVVAVRPYWPKPTDYWSCA